MMIARTSGRSTSSIASGIARSIAWLIALRFSGRLSAIYAISPSIRTLIGFSAMSDSSLFIPLVVVSGSLHYHRSFRSVKQSFSAEKGSPDFGRAGRAWGILIHTLLVAQKIGRRQAE